jgi:hypothetical protein
VVSLLGAGIAGWFAISKGEAAELATKAAEAAKKEATELKAQVDAKIVVAEKAITQVLGERIIDLEEELKNLGTGLTEAQIQEKIKQGVEDGINAIRTAGDKTLNELEEDVDAVAQQANKETRELSQKVGRALKKIKDKLTVQEANNQQLSDDVTKLQRVQSNQGIILQNLEDDIHPKVAGKDVDPTIWELFNPKATLPITTKARESLTGYRSEPPTVSNIELIKTAFEEAENLHQLFQTIPNKFNDTLQADSYHDQINTLRNSISSILGFYKDGDLDSLTNKLNDTHFMIDFDREAIIAKTQAVLEATHKEEPTVDEVKTAQRALVEELKNQFGKTKTERFNADYPDAVENLNGIPTIPWVKEHIDKNVLSKANSQERFEALSDMFLVEEGALDGKHRESPHTNVKVLADDIVPNLEDALVKAYGSNVKKRDSGEIRLTDAGCTGLSQAEATLLDQLLGSLYEFKRSLKPIDPEKHYGSGLLAVKAEDEIKLLDPQETLGYYMIQARLKGDHEEIASITEQMNNLLRTQLQALNDAKSAVVPEVAKAVDSVLETLIQGIPKTATYPPKQGVLPMALPISTFGELAYVKKGMNPSNMLNSFSGQVEEKVRIDLEVKDKSKQEKIGRIIIAVANLKNGEAIDPLLEDLTNKSEIVDYVQNTIKQLSDPAYKLDEVKTIIMGLGQLIKKGLPATKAE